MLKIHHAIHLPNPTDLSKLAFLLVARPSSQMPSLAALTFSLSPFCPTTIQLLSLIGFAFTMSHIPFFISNNNGYDSLFKLGIRITWSSNPSSGFLSSKFENIIHKDIYTLIFIAALFSDQDMETEVPSER